MYWKSHNDDKSHVYVYILFSSNNTITNWNYSTLSFEVFLAKFSLHNFSFSFNLLASNTYVQEKWYWHLLFWEMFLRRNVYDCNRVMVWWYGVCCVTSLWLKIHKFTNLSNMSALHTPSSQTGAERELIVMNAECDSTASVIIVKP